MSATTISVTVLVCTHDRKSLLTRMLESLAAAEMPEQMQVEALVVANNCRDGTHDALDAIAKVAGRASALRLRWLAEPRPGKVHALNTGIRSVASDWVAFVDDDHRLPRDFLSQIDSAIRCHPEAALICGRILPDWDGSEPQWVHDTGPFRVYPLPIPRQDFGDEPRQLDAGGPLPGGGNLFVRTESLREIGPFATQLGPIGHDLGGAEDIEWVMRAIRGGAILQYAPAITQYHHVDPARLALTYLIRKAYRRSASAVAISEQSVPDQRVPMYLYRKLLRYGFCAATALRSDQRRFYLVRSAAALGEIRGHRIRLLDVPPSQAA